MTARSVPKDYVRSVLQNGIGRYVCQLQRLTIKFCKSSPGSRGVRDFIENDLLDFTRRNPGIVIYLKPRRFKGAKMEAEYLNGHRAISYLNKKDSKEICKWVELARTNSGIKSARLRRMWHTDTPSIQGTWTPWTNRSTRLNVAKFPLTDLPVEQSVKGLPEESTTDRLLKLAAKLRKERANVHVLKEDDPQSIEGGHVVDSTRQLDTGLEAEGNQKSVVGR